ncbi:hypothetical protein SCHPADRAFT_904374 [Schizopora paradoxa]|uniref:Uncharacterized protein n=1 Tax=Schizopora paradoxa TaxID=27342 RepID=A0A0H2S8I6_9AGAM|nr:hypothetical protein SCHPADRAFT_904374 [Schizopora paradoxa]
MILFQPLVVSVPLTIIPGLVIALRIFALYERNKYLLAALFAYLLAELAVALWIYLTPYVVRLDVFAQLGHQEISDIYSMHSCMAAVSPKLSSLEVASFQIMESIYNSVALGLILYKTANGKGVLKVIAKQGLLYYVINFTSVMVWTIMLLFATKGLKYTFAGPALGFASMSTNKLTLHLRSYGAPKSGVAELKIDEHVSYRLERRQSWMGMSTFEMNDGGPNHESTQEFTLANRLTAKDAPQLVRANITFVPDFRKSRR